MVVLHESVDATGTNVPVETVRLGSSPREGINLRHVASLAELDGAWEPILVARRTMEIVDGRHRFAAAKKLGHRSIAVTFFDGTEAEARLEAVRVNVRHGLPLSLSERSAAARDLLALFPSWSDRQMGALCALAPRTIARIRTEGPLAGAQIVRFPGAMTDKRLGKDGRQYPVAAGAQRAEIRRLLEAEPSASLRSVATRVGASPETVRSVRRSMAADDGAAPAQQLASVAASQSLPHLARARVGSHWLADSACSSTPEGRDFAQWFDEHQVDAEFVRLMADAVPLSRVYGVIDEARRRAGVWETFAKVLQSRVCGRS